MGLVPPPLPLTFGKGGAAAIAIMLFMAIVSTGSAEQIAVSSLISYDVYRKYINVHATGEDILRVSATVLSSSVSSWVFCPSSLMRSDCPSASFTS